MSDKTDFYEKIIQSDMVALRCFKAGVPFPKEWNDYYLTLRKCDTSKPTGLTAPPFPAGT